MSVYSTHSASHTSVIILRHHSDIFLTPNFVFLTCVSHCVRIVTFSMTKTRDSRSSFTDFSVPDQGKKKEKKIKS